MYSLQEKLIVLKHLLSDSVFKYNDNELKDIVDKLSSSCIVDSEQINSSYISYQQLISWLNDFYVINNSNRDMTDKEKGWNMCIDRIIESINILIDIGGEK